MEQIVEIKVDKKTEATRSHLGEDYFFASLYSDDKVLRLQSGYGPTAENLYILLELAALKTAQEYARKNNLKFKTPFHWKLKNMKVRIQLWIWRLKCT